MLRARLLGALDVELDGSRVDSPPSQRPWAVFAYLALSSRPLARAELATRFWPDVLDQSARASLRSALWSLRRALGDCLLVDGEHVALCHAEQVWIDVREFERLAADDPEQALELCRGELLEGVEDEWAIYARERQREREVELLERLAARHSERGEARAAIELTRRQVARDPLDEDAHRRLIARLAQAGDRAGAMRAYRSLGERLRRELGVAPSPQTRELADGLRAEVPAPSASRSSGAAPHELHGLLALVGRDRELAELERVSSTLGAGSAAAVVIRGEAGIGKTRLACELRQRARASGGYVASCAALDLGGSAPLSLWAELIAELAPSLEPPPADAGWPSDLALLGAELPPSFTVGAAAITAVAPDLQRTRLFEAVVALLGWAARARPLLLVLEDLHGADTLSLELAAYAARRVARLPVMLVLTRRALPPSPAADQLEHALRSRGLLALELDLGPLPDEPIAALARSAARLSGADVERVVRRAEGNALLAVETARALARGQGELAPSLRGSVRATLAQLQGDARELVDVTAVAARPVGQLELAELSLPEPDEAATQALDSGLLLAPGGHLAFRHALLRSAVYEELGEPRRRLLHRRWAHALLAAERLGGTPRPAETAHHLRLGGADAEAAPQLLRAAAEARAMAALEQASGYLHEAVAIAPAAQAWLELGEVEAWRGHREEAEVAFEHALAALKDAAPLELARAWLRRARAYHGSICVPRAVLESSSRAIELIAGAGIDAGQELSEALAARAWAEAVAGDVEEAERLLAKLGRDEAPGNDLRIYDVAHARALALMRRGRFVDSYGPSIAAGDAVARAGRPDLAYGCWVNAAGAAAAAGEHERALEFVDRGMAAIEGQGLQSLEIHLLAARSFVLSRLGRLGQARAAAEAERELAEQLAQPELLAMASHDLGLIALREHDYEQAAALLAESLVANAPVSRPLARLARAEALARSGAAARAQEEVRATVLEPVAASDFPEALVPRLLRVQGLIALAQGDREAARRHLEQAIGGWQRLLAGAHRAATMTAVLADLGRPVVGLVEPESELECARADLRAIDEATTKGRLNAVVP